MTKIQHLEKVAKYLKYAIINSPTHRTYPMLNKKQYLQIEQNKHHNIKLLYDIEKCIQQMKQ
jgi:hypothetical protein